MSIGERIRLLRENRHWTQERLAAESGVPQATISNIERGTVSPLFESVLKITKILDVSLDTLAGIPAKEGGKSRDIDPTILLQLETDSTLAEALKNPEIVKLVIELSLDFPESTTSKENDLKTLLQAAFKVLEK